MLRLKTLRESSGRLRQSGPKYFNKETNTVCFVLTSKGSFGKQRFAPLLCHTAQVQYFTEEHIQTQLRVFQMLGL
jgi:hypothetical protein